jgi:DNA-binding NarL/FixJ family response regulator
MKVETDRRVVNLPICVGMNEDGAPDAPSDNTRILIVMNEMNSPDGLIQAIGFDPELDLVACKATWKNALDWLSNECADVILIYSQDRSVEWISGIRECRRRDPHCDVVVLAENFDANNALACIEAGAVGYLLCGDDSIETTLAGVKELKHGGAPLDTLVARHLVQRIFTAPPVTQSGARPRAAPDAVESLQEKLTSREQSILSLLARGDTYAELAEVLGITVRTVETHAKNIYRKMSVHSRSEAVFEAHQAGLLESW